MLTSKQTAFVDEYLQCWNAAAAARRAGYSTKSARSIGSENLTKPDIRAEIEGKLAACGMTAEEALARLSEIARGTLDYFLRIDDSGVPEFDLSTREALDHLYLIKKARTKRRRRLARRGKEAEKWEFESIEIELYDAQAALFQLGKYHKLFTDRLTGRPQRNVEGLDELLTKVYGGAKKKSKK